MTWKLSPKPALKHVLPALALAVAAIALSACGRGEPEERTFELEIRDGALVQEDSVLQVKQGDIVTMVISADELVSFHLHGYDIEKEAAPEQPATLEFTADATGSFRFTIHIGSGDHHGGEADACEPQLSSGSPTPGIRVTASPGKEPGEIDVAVEVEDFVLSFASADTELATGHWHLSINDEPKGMYVQPEVTTAVSSPGEYQVTVGLSDVKHCDYGIDAMTTVVVREGQVGGEEEEAAKAEDGDKGEIELGRLEVYPR